MHGPAQTCSLRQAEAQQIGNYILINIIHLETKQLHASFLRLNMFNRKAGKLLVRNSWCGGLYTRDIVIDAVHSRVVIARRFLRFFKTKRVIPFRKIRCVAYDYQGPSASTIVRLSEDVEEEFFFVGLKLEDQTVIPLFQFSGFKRGTQEEDSRNYAQELSEMIGVADLTDTPAFFNKSCS
jgi:hypothetical protein